ncbi:MAG: site-specific integrase [Bacteroidales bacterium]|nr:site-specific integrase [Bacteroidales bacterium]
MKATKVFLRQRKLNSGKITLYLDYYPPLRDPVTQEHVFRDYLGIYLVDNPKFAIEKEANKEKLRQANAIRSERELAIIRGQFDFLDKHKQKMDFLAYFRKKLESKDQKWIRVYDHFKNYCHGKCLMSDITVPFCEGFREYLLKAKHLKNESMDLSQNSAAGYWSTFRGCLKIAYHEKMLKENVNDFLEPISGVSRRREYLTLEEVRQLANTPCDVPDLKNASLFSCLTGLRISDILALDWSNIVKAQDGGWCIRIRTEKTDTEATLPLTDEAYRLCGKRSTGLVFKNLKRYNTHAPLKEWVEAAGITKHITFHCFRHTFATLQVNGGTDIYTVSHLLTHANVGTTQIYADIVDKSMRDAVERIKIKDEAGPKGKKKKKEEAKDE